jgi:GT2 family glycosyltransferase
MTKGPSSPDVSIVFTNWNTRDYLRDCLRSVIARTQGLTYEIIVVDDGSTDGSVEMLRSEFPDVIQVVNGRNIGVAKAYNRGVAVVRGRFIQMLNTDMILIDNAIRTLMDFLEVHPDVGACGGWLLNRDMTSQISFGAFPSFSQAIVDALFLNDIFPKAGFPNRGAYPDDSLTEPFEAEYVTGASLMIRKEIVDRIGFFDERYTSYCEETDFCYRVRRQLGMKLFVIPAAKIIHFGGASFGKVRKYQIQLQYSSYDKFLTKYHNKVYSFCTRALYAWHYFVKMFVRLGLYITSSAEKKNEKKNQFLNACYIIRYSLLPTEKFTGK